MIGSWSIPRSIRNWHQYFFSLVCAAITGISGILDKVDKGVFFEVLLLCHTGMPPLVVAHSTATTEIVLPNLELAMTS